MEFDSYCGKNARYRIINIYFFNNYCTQNLQFKRKIMFRMNYFSLKR